MTEAELENVSDNWDVHGIEGMPAVLTAEITRLYNLGHSLIPLGGPDGKKSIVKFNGRKRLPLDRVLGLMKAAGNQTYGIRLDGMIVVDVDTDTAEAQAYVERRFGVSSVQVQTSRGRHHYFRHTGPKPKNVSMPGVQIDFKSGLNHYVAGSFSTRPDGVSYWPQLGQLGRISDLPQFVDNEPDVAAEVGNRVASKIRRGERNSFLYRKAAELAWQTTLLPNLVSELAEARDQECEEPSSVHDDEIQKIAKWAWDKKINNQLYLGRRSAVQVPRSAIDVLAAQGEALACLLYNVILSEFGHKPTASFAIVPDGLLQSGKLKAGRRQIYAAIRVLIDQKLIFVAEISSKPKEPHKYQLIREGGGKRKEEGFINYIDTRKGHTGFVVYEGGKANGAT
jgi:hypothetical protein